MIEKFYQFGLKDETGDILCVYIYIIYIFKDLNLHYGPLGLGQQVIANIAIEKCRITPALTFKFILHYIIITTLCNLDLAY